MIVMKLPIAFDWDGTLFQVHLLAVPAYITVFTRLAQEGVIESVPSREKFLSIFGMVSEDIWEYLLPGTSRELKDQVARDLVAEEDKIRDRGILYPGVRETLLALRESGHPLFVVSNGTEDYIKGACADTGLAPLLQGIYSAGQYKTATKVELLARVIADNRLGAGLMVGDRGMDMEAGRENGFTTVGCAYGYADREELRGADYLIEDIRELPSIVQKL